MKLEQERVARVEARINLIRAQGEFPALSDQIREVMAVSQDEDAALDRLADLVLKNYGLTLRVLRTVNSIHYNRSGQPILSVARAIVLLGVRAVREMAASFLIVDHYQRRSAELKRLMMLSMVTASHAESLSAFNPKVRPDEAYVCGMFRNLGEVLIANHFHDEYVRILAASRAAGTTTAEAALKLLGFGFEDLGAAMARHWGMPAVGEAMLPAAGGTSLRAVTELGHALTALVYRSDAPPAPDAVAKLVARFRLEIPVPPDRIAGLVQESAALVRTVFQSLGASAEELGLLARGDPPARSAAGSPRPGAGTGSPQQPAREVRSQLLSEVAAVTDVDGFDLNRALLILLEALTRGGPFDRALFCLIDGDRDEVRARLALGDESESLGAAFRFRVGSRQTPISAALTDREPVFVGRGGRPQDGLLAKALGAETFAVLPLTVEDQTIGCLYCDRRSAAEAPDPATMMFLGRVQVMAEQAIGRSRRQAARV